MTRKRLRSSQLVWAHFSCQNFVVRKLPHTRRTHTSTTFSICSCKQAVNQPTYPWQLRPQLVTVLVEALVLVRVRVQGSLSSQCQQVTCLAAKVTHLASHHLVQEGHEGALAAAAQGLQGALDTARLAL